jgi:hypothetical protein
MAQKRIQERQTITEARTSDKTLFYRIIRQQNVQTLKISSH